MGQTGCEYQLRCMHGHGHSTERNSDQSSQGGPHARRLALAWRSRALPSGTRSQYLRSPAAESVRRLGATGEAPTRALLVLVAALVLVVQVALTQTGQEHERVTMFVMLAMLAADAAA